MQSDFRTKKGTPQETVEHEPMETEQREEKIEKIKREFGVFDAMKEIESEITALKKLLNNMFLSSHQLNKRNILYKIEQGKAKVVKEEKEKGGERWRKRNLQVTS